MTRARNVADIIKQPFTTTLGTSNYRAGVNAGNSIAAGTNFNVIIGDEAGTALNVGDENTLIGYAAGDALLTGEANIAIGKGALGADTKGNVAVAIGVNALAIQDFTTAASNYNVAVGYQTGVVLETGIQNVFIGGLAGDGTDDGDGNVAVGFQALSGNCGDSNTAVGVDAGIAITGSTNTVIGVVAGKGITSGGNNTCLGHAAGRASSPGGNITTASNVITLGDNSVTACNIKVDWTVSSDQRDKTDFTALDIGLDFVKALKPVTYKWDQRSDYGDSEADDWSLSDQTPDGTHKKDWLDVGFKAQEVEALEQAAGYNKSNKTNLTVSLSPDGEQYGMKYSKFIPILVKSVQELSTALDAALARIATLEG